MTTVAELQEKAARLLKVLDQYHPSAGPKPVLADFGRVQNEMMWGGLWHGGALDLELRSFATIVAQCVNGYAHGLERQIRIALTTGVTAQKIKGIFIELMFYAGVPATVSGLRIAHNVINEREAWKADDVPLDVEWLNEIDDMLRQGRTLIVRNWGAAAALDIEGSLARQMIPEGAAIVDGYHFGQVWARADLSPKERTVTILAALMCRGHWKQLRGHVGYALDAGLSAKAICEVFAQAGWYRGWPHVEDALEVAKAVFVERGVAP